MSAGSRPAGRDFAAAGERHLSIDVVLAWRPSPKLLAVGALLAAIALSPRIPLPLPIPGRAFELRIEDVILLLLLPFWLATRRQLGGALGRMPVAFMAYLAATLLSTAFGVLVIGLSPLRALAYWGKAVEMLLIAVIVATWMRDRSDRVMAAVWLLVLGLANAAWFAIQLLEHKRSALFEVPYPAGVVVRPTQFESYGPGLIGEISPLATGAFLMLLFLLAFGLFEVARSRRAALGYLAAAAAFLAFTVDSQSRVSIVGAVLGAGVLAVARRPYRRALAGFAACAVVAVAVTFATNSDSINRLTAWHDIAGSFTYRIQNIYEPLMARLAPKPAATPGVSPTGLATPGVSPTSLPTAGPHATAAPTPLPGVSPSGALATPGPQATVAPQPVATPGDWRNAPTAAGSQGGRDFRGRSLVVAAIGRGSGAMGSPGLALPTEAHNHFLRVFLESGLLGLATFGGLLLSVFWLLYRTLRRGGATPLDRGLCAVALAALAAFVAGALVQDMFLPVIPNELLWAMVGLAAATGLGAARREQPS